MATGTTSTFSSNLELGLAAAPQGVYNPVEQNDITDLYGATQSLSQSISDAFTVRIMFLTAMTAGTFVTVSPSTTEAIAVKSSNNTRVLGFLVDEVGPGDYGRVFCRGINRFLTGLSPGVAYFADVNGGVTTVGVGGVLLGFALDENTLVVQSLN